MKLDQLIACLLVTLFLWGGPSPNRSLSQEAIANGSVTSGDFLEHAVSILPEEDRYTYHKSFLQGSIHQPSRDPDAVAQGNELVLDRNWNIIELSGGPLATYAKLDTVEFFHLAMNVTISPQEANELNDHSSKMIIVGTPASLIAAGVNLPFGEQLRSRKDYELRVEGDRVYVCGYDDAGVMHGLFHLQSRMKLRQAPFLPRDLHTVRHSRFQSRLVLSWLGWMQWPDKYLAHLAHDGYDAIYASVYANPNGVPGPPHYDLIRQQNPDKLRKLIQRARLYGIRVYAPILFNNTGEAENKEKLREHVRDIVTKFPEIHGYILLTEGFFYKKFFGAGSHGAQDLKEWAAQWTDAVKIVVEECHQLDPAIEVLPWEYNIDFRPGQIEIKRHVVKLLPQDSIPLLTWENGKRFQLGPFNGFLRDYSISQVGPAEVAAAQIDEAKNRDMKIYCKSDCFATWQFGTMPYLPCPQQWQRRYNALAKFEVDGTLETWSNGYKPNFISELRCWSAWSDSIPDQDLLNGMARQLFGPGSEERVVAAWQHFSNAIQMVPDTGPSMGTNNAVAHPLFLDEPESRIMTLHNSWWDEAKKTSWRHRMVEAWPYCHPIMVMLPDFKNRSNKAEAYAATRSGVSMLEQSSEAKGQKVLPVFNQHVWKAADELERGLKLYRAAALAAPVRKQEIACKEVLIVEQMQRMLRGLHAIMEFEDLRFTLASTKDLVAANHILDRMEQIVQAEITRTEQSIQTTKRDSRLGYECEMDYVYTPRILKQKLDLLNETIDEQIPRRREKLQSR